MLSTINIYINLEKWTIWSRYKNLLKHFCLPWRDLATCLGRLSINFLVWIIIIKWIEVRTMLEAIISFLPSEGAGAIGALDWTPEERKRLAIEVIKYIKIDINKIYLTVQIILLSNLWKSIWFIICTRKWWIKMYW